jgi:hypothetical protein
MTPSIGPTLDKAAIIEEVEKGLRNERSELADAYENQQFYDLEAEGFEPRREAETEFDYAGRPKRTSGFTRQAVNRLCQHTYNPGPQRSVQEPDYLNDFLMEVYEQVHIDAVMNECEKLSTLNNVAAIQVCATEDSSGGELPDKPIDLQIWGRDEFTVFLDPNDQRKAFAVVTIDKYDEQTRYRLWFDDEVHTFVTRKPGMPGNPEITAYRLGGPEENTYGCLPFAFVHYEAPVRRFWTPGPGTFLRRGEKRINDSLSELAEALKKYRMPIGIFVNVGSEYNPEVGPGRFLRLISGTGGYTGDGYAPQGAPDVRYLQATIDVDSSWNDLHNFMGQLAEAIDLPPAALRLDYSDAPSGISIIIRAFPLLTRARQRRPVYQWAECEVAKIMLRCMGNHYSKPDLVTAADTLKLLLSWPEPRIPVPSPERDQADDWELAQGIKSRVDVCQERFGLTEEQAIQRIQEVAEEEAQVQALLPNRAIPGELHPGMAAQNGQADEEQNGQATYFGQQAKQKNQEVEEEESES